MHPGGIDPPAGTSLIGTSWIWDDPTIAWDFAHSKGLNWFIEDKALPALRKRGMSIASYKAIAHFDTYAIFCGVSIGHVPWSTSVTRVSQPDGMWTQGGIEYNIGSPDNATPNPTVKRAIGGS